MNFSKAAIYLQYMLSEKWREQRFKDWLLTHLKFVSAIFLNDCHIHQFVPRITTTDSVYLKQLEFQFTGKKEVQVTGNKDATNKKNLEDISEKEFRRPLFLALHLTPLILLASQRLDSKLNGQGQKYSEWELIEVSTTFLRE